MRAWIGMMGLGLCLVALDGCHRRLAAPKAAPSPAGAAATAEIAWREGDVDDALAEAKETNRPVLLYWGAVWCPPCNLMKQTLFKDPAFVAETRNFVAVHLDGDGRDAQTWGQRLGVDGYPTIIVLRPDRVELTRLSGASATQDLAPTLRVVAHRSVSAEDLFARADHPAALSADDWKVLGDYAWHSNVGRLADRATAAALAGTLAGAAPDPALGRRLRLVSLSLSIGGDGGAKLDAGQLQAVATVLPAILADPAEVRANRFELAYNTVPLILALPDAATRTALGAKLLAAEDALAADATIPPSDRLAAVQPAIALSRAAHGGTVDAEVRKAVQARVALVDRAADTPGLRQALIPDAASALDDVGDLDGATALLKAELPRAVSPHYFMGDLADIAEERHDTAGAIAWAKQAAEAAQGSATRVQWALAYSATVMRLTPDDRAAVEHAADTVVAALAGNQSGYARRTARKTADWGRSLREWSAAHDGAAVVTHVSAGLGQACGSGDGAEACRRVLEVS